MSSSFPDHLKAAREKLWLDGARDIEMNEDVVGLGAYRRTLTVLHTDQAIGDDDDETEQEEDNSKTPLRRVSLLQGLAGGRRSSAMRVFR